MTFDDESIVNVSNEMTRRDEEDVENMDMMSRDERFISFLRFLLT